MTFQEALSKVDSITDALGKPVDTNIKKLVAALILHGFPTNGSCEGHIDSGEAYPWVTVGTEDNQTAPDPEVKDTRVNKLANQLHEIAKEYKNIDLYTVLYFVKTEARYHITATKDLLECRSLEEITDETKTKLINQQHKVRILSLLNDFYKARPHTEYALILSLEPIGIYGTFSLQNNGSITNGMVGKKEKTNNIKRFIKEMDLFADYLIDTNPS
jgi:hypothetical protein